MPCFHPRTGYPPHGGGRILFTRPAGHSGRTQQLPCGKCIGCRVDYSGDWSARIMHECLFYTDNWFVTFTYDDSHLPLDECVSKREVQLLKKKLRNAGLSQRGVFNGEYGSVTRRPHYHAIIFGLVLTDLKKYKRNERGEQLYTSATLDAIWGKGRVLVGAVTRESARYVAGYIVRDTGKDGGLARIVDPSTGEVIDRTPPFILHPRRPGVGFKYFERYGSQLAAEDNIVIEGRRQRAPAYYHRLMERSDPATAARLKDARQAMALEPRARRERRPERLKAREVCADAKRRIARRGSRAGAV